MSALNCNELFYVFFADPSILLVIEVLQIPEKIAHFTHFLGYVRAIHFGRRCEVLHQRLNQSVVISAHKYILDISSSVFFAMFYGEMAEPGDTIELPDCISESFLELLDLRIN